MGVKYIEDIDDLEMDKWIMNLRSGQFLQTTRQMAALDDNTGESAFCCLGVLSVGMGVKSADLYWQYLPEQEEVARLNLPKRYVGNTEAGRTTIRVNAARMDRTNFVTEVEGVALISVTHLNDDFLLDFNGIADRLEDTFLRPEFKVK